MKVCTASADIQVGGSGVYGEAAVIRLSGTWTGTVTFKARVRGGAASWTDIMATNAETLADALTATTSGIYRVIADGLDIQASFVWASGTLVMDTQEELILHQESLEPFSFFETLRSVPVWGLSLTHLGAWLGAFIVLDKTVMSGQRFDKLGKFVCRRVTALAGIDVVQHGTEHLKPGESYIFCINHVSLLDLFVVFQSIPYFHRSFQEQTQCRG